MIIVLLLQTRTLRQLVWQIVTSLSCKFVRSPNYIKGEFLNLIPDVPNFFCNIVRSSTNILVKIVKSKTKPLIFLCFDRSFRLKTVTTSCYIFPGIIIISYCNFSRRSLSPTFSSSKLKEMFGIVEQCSDQMVEALEKCALDCGGIFDPKEWVKWKHCSA